MPPIRTGIRRFRNHGARRFLSDSYNYVYNKLVEHKYNLHNHIYGKEYSVDGQAGLSNYQSEHLLNNTSGPELHLFIIWANAMESYNKIFDDISDYFEVIRSYEIKWSTDKFSENLSRFYGQNLPDESKKQQHIGTDSFRLIVVSDPSPEYRIRKTNQGYKRVNINTYNRKSKYRRWTGGGHKIHATDSYYETSHDLTLLLGKSPEDVMERYNDSNRSTEVLSLERDLKGANGWKSLEELFYVLNSTIPYVVIRNFGPLPDDNYKNNHGDIDILCSNYLEMCHITNSEELHSNPSRVQNTVSINGKNITFDFRYVGDSYYDTSWEIDILSRRKFNDGFNVPDPEHHFYSLLYHALLHKENYSLEYKNKLKNMIEKHNIPIESSEIDTKSSAFDTLNSYLKSNSYELSNPIDNSVVYNPI